MQKTASQYLFTFRIGGPLNFAIYSDFCDFRNFIGKLRKMAIYAHFHFSIKISQEQHFQWGSYFDTSLLYYQSMPQTYFYLKFLKILSGTAHLARVDSE